MARIEDYLNRKFGQVPKEKIGIGGFTAYVSIEDKTSKTASAPITPVEDGSFVNDHIILNPVRLSIRGDVSDVHIKPSPLISQLKRTQTTVGSITQYAPARTASQVQQVNALINDLSDAIRKADALLATGEQVLKYFGNKDGSTKSNQEQFIDAMDALYYGKQLFSVDTDYRRYDNMYVESFVAVKNNQADSISFTLDLVEFRFVSSVFSEIATPSVGLGGQIDPEDQKGVQTGTDVDQSLLFTLIGRG